jgi:hypothetical protein
MLLFVVDLLNGDNSPARAAGTEGPGASGMLSVATTPAMRFRGLPCDPSALDRGWSRPNVR